MKTLFVVLIVAGVSGDTEPTTKTYELEVPGKDPIRIIEREPLWKTKPGQRSLSAEAEDPIHEFLENYAASIRKNVKGSPENHENLKKWDLIDEQNKPTYPYNERKGWVSMDPIPWSVSKVSKWHSKYQPTSNSWSDYESEEQTEAPWKKPPNKYESLAQNKPKPSALYAHLEEYLQNKYHHKHDKNCNHHQNAEDDIITDGLAPNFPKSYEASRRQATEILPDNHPFSGNGDWVLLSTTKGYKHPQKQRSLQINPQSVGAHRGVRLTVLPPLKNSKVNMTTSHGGLLQVEGTFETVEQSRKQYRKRQKLKTKSQNKKKPMRRVATPTSLKTTKKSSGPDSSAVLAAVGAGMIPATMAMLVPMALGGRRKREIPTVPINLPSNL